MKKETLVDLYIEKRFSVADIAKKFACSQSKINYWLDKHQILKRSISDAIYLKHNPKGDPFKFKKPKTNEEWMLLGMGIGLYWGEGNKRNKSSLRLGNVDPNLIRVYINFLTQIYSVKKEKLKFGLQIFSDVKPRVAKTFWMKMTGASASQFYKVIVTPSRGEGTYRNKSSYGVLTVYFNNTKLKKVMDGLIENFPSV